MWYQVKDNRTIALSKYQEYKTKATQTKMFSCQNESQEKFLILLDGNNTLLTENKNSNGNSLPISWL